MDGARGLALGGRDCATTGHQPLGEDLPTEHPAVGHLLALAQEERRLLGEGRGDGTVAAAIPFGLLVTVTSAVPISSRSSTAQQLGQRGQGLSSRHHSQASP